LLVKDSKNFDEERYHNLFRMSKRHLTSLLVKTKLTFPVIERLQNLGSTSNAVAHSCVLGKDC